MAPEASIHATVSWGAVSELDPMALREAHHAAARTALLDAVAAAPVVVVAGPSSLGAAATLPSLLCDAGLDRLGAVAAVHARAAVVAHSREIAAPGRPRRIAWLSAAQLLTALVADPLIQPYAAVVLDGFHERAVHTDLLLALLVKVVRQRPRLRVVVVAATAAAVALIQRYVHAHLDATDAVGVALPAPVPTDVVTIQHATAPVRDYRVAVAETVVALHRRAHAAGDRRGVLCFLPTPEDIRALTAMLTDLLGDADGAGRGDRDDDGGDGIEIIPFGEHVSREDMAPALAAAHRGYGSRRRRIVLATDLAESAVLLPDIGHVVDTGLVARTTTLLRTGAAVPIVLTATAAIAQDAAALRALAAGRSGGGTGAVYRLYPRAVHDRMAPSTPPAITRTSLADTVLLLHALGVAHPLRFAFPTPPSADQIASAYACLVALGWIVPADAAAVDPSALAKRRPPPTAVLEPQLGAEAAMLPLSPFLSALVLRTAAAPLSPVFVTLAALLVDPDVYTPVAPRRARERLVGFAAADGDHVTLLNVYSAWLAAHRSAGWCRRHGLRHRVLEHAHRLRGHLEDRLDRLQPRLPRRRRRQQQRAPGDIWTDARAWADMVERHADADADAAAGDRHHEDEGEDVVSVAVRRALLDLAASMVAQLQPGGTYRQLPEAGRASPGPARIAASSVLVGAPPPWLLFTGGTIDEAGETRLYPVSAVKPRWIRAALDAQNTRLAPWVART
ncbi:hypothetical protein CXG81DRAFT_23711 [Caulochytrium protostelioides]|uniref:Helicase-associated domain-containing protein n=1 Tax=Caulochytrium protostelioides TaxID=1555241 RepID=A0A4P9XDP2_9FUNG|nr:hypothetical protein CXG81DRAFT_23711 [Caulochytrium protostelioides]|eukprot:RKP03598.1 hypothetical protein CXG81DRAFT_23711 [Caulochytrium protostelioides]